MSKRNLRRSVLAASALIILSAALIGCSAPAPSDGTTTEATSILFINPLPSYPAWRDIGDCMAEEAEAVGADFSEAGSSSGTLDSEFEIARIQQAIANQVDAIMVFPSNPAQYGPLLQQAGEAGIVTGAIWGGNNPENQATVDIGPDFGAMAQKYVDAISAFGGDQVVGLISGGPTGPTKVFEDAFKEAAAATDNVTIAEVVYTGDDASKALDAASNLLTAHPEINVLASSLGTATAGATSAIKQRDAVGDVVFVGGGTANGALEGFEDGTVGAIYLQDVCGGGRAAIDAVIAAVEGDVVPYTEVETRMVTPDDDVQSFIDDGWQ